jgi:organic radical activating enzyme
MCGGPDGSLMKEGKATWWCDSEAIWRNGIDKDFKYLIERWQSQNILDWVLDGRVHLIWTGGEPTIPKHQKNIVAFLEELEHQYKTFKDPGAEKMKVFNEIETNGTIHITDDLFDKLQQINCSVKLANSGMTKNRRIKPGALERIMEHENYWFKFVVSDEKDIDEIKSDFIKPFNIPPERVLMMPGLDSQVNYHERTRFCLELAKKHGYIGLSRLHISAWNQTTGV